MTPRRPTMNDVAALAGVSLSTVSRVVNGHGAVRADFVERVEQAIRALGYRRDHAASTLRRADRASGSVGLVFEDVSNPFFSAIHRGSRRSPARGGCSRSWRARTRTRSASASSCTGSALATSTG